VEIFARTTCTLWPRKSGGKEDIRVRTLLGRFFEHSRFFIFEAGDESTYLLGSADLMRRNLDHRIEILVPVEDAALMRRARARGRRAGTVSRGR
jgi:polyphosphate kinase